jgi:ribosome-associated protein
VYSNECKPGEKTLTSRTLAKKIAQFALSKKAYDVVLLDLHSLTSAADFFVLCSADSDTQVRAIADAVEKGGEEIGATIWHKEGFHASTWVILDFVDVVVHVFHHETRSYYNLERLWSDAKATLIEDKPDQPATPKKPAKAAKVRRVVGKQLKV